MARDLFCRRNRAGIVRHAIWAVRSFRGGFGGVASLTGGGERNGPLRGALSVADYLRTLSRGKVMDSLARSLGKELVITKRLPTDSKRTRRKALVGVRVLVHRDSQQTRAAKPSSHVMSLNSR